MTEREIRINLKRLHPWEKKVIIGQLKRGDRAGAEKGLQKLIARKDAEKEKKKYDRRFIALSVRSD